MIIRVFRILCLSLAKELAQGNSSAQTGLVYVKAQNTPYTFSF